MPNMTIHDLLKRGASLNDVEKYWRNGWISDHGRDTYLAMWNAQPHRLVDAEWRDGAIRTRDVEV